MMVGFPTGGRTPISVWGWGVATCLVGVAAVFGLATVAPVAMEHSALGLSVRVAVCSLCMAGFVFTGWRS